MFSHLNLDIDQVNSSAFVFHSSFLFQEEKQWRSLEQLFNADRHSLLDEVRSLHASSQQSQEQLRQLQDSLHTAKEQGMETQHHLHRDGKYFRLICGQKVKKMTANIKIGHKGRFELCALF